MKYLDFISSFCGGAFTELFSCGRKDGFSIVEACIWNKIDDIDDKIDFDFLDVEISGTFVKAGLLRSSRKTD